MNCIIIILTMPKNTNRIYYIITLLLFIYYCIIIILTMPKNTNRIYYIKDKMKMVVEDIIFIKQKE